MSEQTVRQEQLQLLPAYQEEFLKDLLASTTEQAGIPTYIPERQVAALTPAQLQAIQLGLSGVGSYFPMMQAGEQTIAGGVGTYEEAIRQALGAQPYLTSAGQMAQQAVAGAQPYQASAQQAISQALRQAQQAPGMAAQPISEAQRQFAAQQGRLAQLGATTGRETRGIADALAGQLGTATGRTQAEAAAAQRAAQEAITGARGVTGRAGEQILGAAGGLAPITESSIEALRGTTGRFSPEDITPFMSEFEDAAVQQALSDLRRQGQLEAQKVAAQGVASGAFGGSREAIAQQELARNVMEQQGRTAAQMRAQGFESAAQRAQQAFEQQQARGAQAALGTGQLGLAQAQLGTQAGEAAGRLGLSAEQLAAQTGLSSGQLGMSAQQQAAANAAQMAQTGMSAEQIAAQTGLSVEQARAAASQAGAGLGVQQAQLGLQGAGQAGQLGQGLAGLGTSFGQLGLQGAGAMGTVGQAFGQLGQGLGGLAGGMAKTGLSQAALGESAQAAQQRDINALLSLGGLEQQQAQQQLEAQRATELERQYAPYQQISFMSDIFRGVPSTQQTLTQSTAPSPSTISQVAGLGVGLAGLNQAGVFDLFRGCQQS
jgi:hypothetical protein